MHTRAKMANLRRWSNGSRGAMKRPKDEIVPKMANRARSSWLAWRCEDGKRRDSFQDGQLLQGGHLRANCLARVGARGRQKLRSFPRWPTARGKVGPLPVRDGSSTRNQTRLLSSTEQKRRGSVFARLGHRGLLRVWNANRSAGQVRFLFSDRKQKGDAARIAETCCVPIYSSEPRRGQGTRLLPRWPTARDLLGSRRRYEHAKSRDCSQGVQLRAEELGHFPYKTDSNCGTRPVFSVIRSRREEEVYLRGSAFAAFCEFGTRTDLPAKYASSSLIERRQSIGVQAASIPFICPEIPTKTHRCVTLRSKLPTDSTEELNIFHSAGR